MAKVKMVALVSREVLDEHGAVDPEVSLEAGQVYVYDTAKPDQLARMERWLNRGAICKPEEFEAQQAALEADRQREAAVADMREAAAGNASALTRQVETLQRELEATSDELSKTQAALAELADVRNQALDDLAKSNAELEAARARIAALEAEQAGGDKTAGKE